MVSLEDIVVNDQDIKSNNWFVDILIHKQWLLQNFSVSLRIIPKVWTPDTLKPSMSSPYASKCNSSSVYYDVFCIYWAATS